MYSLGRRRPGGGHGPPDSGVGVGAGGGGGGGGVGGGGGGRGDGGVGLALGGGGRDGGGSGGLVAALYLESMSSAVHGETRVFVMAVTANPLRLYLFMGGPTLEVRWSGLHGTSQQSALSRAYTADKICTFKVVESRRRGSIGRWG